MSLAERIYHWLLRLYPAKHRKDFQEDMLQHARDLNRDASQQGQWYVARLCISLLKDGILNAWKEHWEGNMTANRAIKPASWWIAMIAALPGLLILLTRRPPTQQLQLDPMIWYLYLGLLLIGVPLTWRRFNKFPV